MKEPRQPTTETIDDFVAMPESDVPKGVRCFPFPEPWMAVELLRLLRAGGTLTGDTLTSDYASGDQFPDGSAIVEKAHLPLPDGVS